MTFRAAPCPPAGHAGTAPAGAPDWAWRTGAGGGPVIPQSQERRWRPSWPIDLVTTLGVLSHGRGDPTIRIIGRQVWRTTRTPAGPATVHYARQGGEVLARAWGPGAELELDALPRVLGADDDPQGFAADAHPVMAAAYRRFGPGWRVLRTTRVVEALVPAVLEQRVTGVEANRAWADLVRRFGEPAPGPAGSGSGRAAGNGPIVGGAGRLGSSGLVVPPDGRRLGADPELGLAPGRRGPGTRTHDRHGRRPSRGPRAAVRARRPRTPARRFGHLRESGAGPPPRSASGRGGIAMPCRSATSTWHAPSCTP